MRSRILAVAIGVAAMAAWWLRPSEVAAPVAARVEPEAIGIPVAASPAPEAPAPVTWEERTDAVAAECDLPIEARCEDGACAALLAGPDLDGPIGWLGLAISSPRFVASTALRDLGVGADTLPCGAAIDALVAGDGVPMIELPDGTELWCGGDVALCDRMARDRHGASGFGEPDVRRLRFDP